MAIPRSKTKVLMTIIGVLAAGAFGAAYFLGYVTDDDINRAGRKVYYEGRGAVGDAEKALTSGSTAKGDYGAAAKCRRNIKDIEVAKRATADRRGQAVGTVGKADIEKALGHPIPKCPAGGFYKIQDINMMPTCTVGAAGLNDPKDDHFLNNF